MCIFSCHSGSRASNAEEMEKIAPPPLPPKEWGVRWANLAIFFLDLGLGEVCSGDAWNLLSKATSIGVSAWSVQPKGPVHWCLSVLISCISRARMDRHACIATRPHHNHHNQKVIRPRANGPILIPSIPVSILSSLVRPPDHQNPNPVIISVSAGFRGALKFQCWSLSMALSSDTALKFSPCGFPPGLYLGMVVAQNS